MRSVLVWGWLLALAMASQLEVNSLINGYKYLVEASLKPTLSPFPRIELHDPVRTHTQIVFAHSLKEEDFPKVVRRTEEQLMFLQLAPILYRVPEQAELTATQLASLKKISLVSQASTPLHVDPAVIITIIFTGEESNDLRQEIAGMVERFTVAPPADL